MRWQVAGAFGPATPGCRWRRVSVTIRNRMATRNVLIGVLSTLAASPTCVAQSFHSAARAARPTGSETLLVFPLENSSRLAKLEWLGEGLAELTIERLSHAGQFAFPREERLAAIEKLGLPASTRYSRATMLKIAEEVDADYVLFGHYSSDGKNFTVSAQVLHVDPPRLMPPLEESGALEELMEMHARLAWRVYCGVATASAGVAPCGRMALSQADFLSKFPPLRLDAFEYYIRGLLSPESEKDQQRLRDLREAARLEPGWDDPAFALGQAYFARRDCASALPWLSREPEQGRRTVAPGKICLAEREGWIIPAGLQPRCLPKVAQPLLVFLGFRAEQAPNVILESIQAQRGKLAQEISLAECHPAAGSDPS